jgi:hypothetical protein
MHTSPVASTGTTTAFGSTAPFDEKFTDDVDGSGEPHAHTRNQPGADVSTAVTFNATPATPDAGTPNRSNTGTCNGAPGRTTAADPRVSTNRPVAGRNPLSNQPDTSTTASDTADVAMHTSPVASTGTTTAFGSTAPFDEKFTDDVVGSGDPHGQARNQPADAGFTAVTFNATPATPLAGTPK